MTRVLIKLRDRECGSVVETHSRRRGVVCLCLRGVVGSKAFVDWSEVGRGGVEGRGGRFSAGCIEASRRAVLDAMIMTGVLSQPEQRVI